MNPTPTFALAACPRRSRQRAEVASFSAFTLIELLIVLAIIAVLASLLLPALTAAKARTRSATCVNNLRQLGISLQLYLQDEGYYPLATAGDGLGDWQRSLRGAAGPKVFFCPQPGKATEQFVALFNPSNSFIFPHYGYNYLGAARRNSPPFNLGLGGYLVSEDTRRRFLPTRESRVVTPSDMIAIGDTPAFLYVNLGQPPPDPADVLYLIFPHIVPQFDQPGVGAWHNGKANMLFSDGHTESAPESSWTNASGESRRRWNNDHLPHEECW